MTQSKGQQADIRLLPTTKIQTNTGQVPGLPRNPSLIKDAQYTKLKRSISDFPQMLELREIVVFPHKTKFVCVGGNMRFLACKELGFEEVPCKVLPPDYPIERLAEFAIKDNIRFGQDDMDILIRDWKDLPLGDWGSDLPDLADIDLDDFFKQDDSRKDKQETFSIVLNYTTEQECEKVKNALDKHGKTFEAAVNTLLKL